jgi:hypothetical protein
MRKLLLPVFALLAAGVLLAGCGTPPPLVSNDYLNDTSLVDSDDTCEAPCYQDIVPGTTTFADAVGKLQNNSLFKDVQSQDSPPQAVWSTQGGTQCCNLAANPDTGLVEVVLIRTAPVMTLLEVIEKYGEPEYVVPQEYTPEEVALGLLYPEEGFLAYVTPGGTSASISDENPVVVVLYFNPDQSQELIDGATLFAWQGLAAFNAYQNATPIVTPKPTLTPTPGG